MTKKIAISVPDDVAERLAKEPNVSAYITEAIRRRITSESTREALLAAGFNITDEALARAGEELRRLHVSITPELRAQAAAIQAELSRARSGTGAEVAKAIERIRQISQGEAAA